MSHYWDCRLKGRPPGTPKSDDPTKRKRKRHARERDLCDVKIKITEYFPGARVILDQEFNGSTEDQSAAFFGPGEHSQAPLEGLQQPRGFGVIAPIIENISSLPGSNGERFFTIQRVNGNGGNGKGDGVAGPHKHTLEESDRVKKNSVQRQLLKEEKETKKIKVCYSCCRSVIQNKSYSRSDQHIGASQALRHVIDQMASLLNFIGPDALSFQHISIYKFSFRRRCSYDDIYLILALLCLPRLQALTRNRPSRKHIIKKQPGPPYQRSRDTAGNMS